MNEEMAAILTIQLASLLCIAGALLLYLISKINKRKHTYDVIFSINVGTGKSVLITCCDTIFGIQLALHLSALGFRVFAGTKEMIDRGNANRIFREKLKERDAVKAKKAEGNAENEDKAGRNFGAVISVPLDVTREDSLHEALDNILRHLPAGEDGLWAVVNTSGICSKENLNHQDSFQWENIFKVNVYGTLRAARTFLPLLKKKSGRLVNIGISNECNSGYVAYSGTRHAVSGINKCLTKEKCAQGVDIVTIHAQSITGEQLFHLPKLNNAEDNAEKYLKYNVTAVPNYVMNVFEEILLTGKPKSEYYMDKYKPDGVTNYVAAIKRKLRNVFNKNHIAATIENI